MNMTSQMMDSKALLPSKQQMNGVRFDTEYPQFPSFSSSELSLGDMTSPAVSDTFIRDHDQFVANRARNHGYGPPFAVGNPPLTKLTGPVPGLEDFRSPRERQANNPNLNKNTFESIFGEETDESGRGSKVKGQVSNLNPITWSAHTKRLGIQREPIVPPSWRDDATAPAGYVPTIVEMDLHKKGLAPDTKYNPVTWSAKAQALQDGPQSIAKPPAGQFKRSDFLDDCSKVQHPHAKVPTHNPVTWEAYSNYDADRDRPAHRSRFESFASIKKGSNPILPIEAPLERIKQSPRPSGAGPISNVTF